MAEELVVFPTPPFPPTEGDDDEGNESGKTSTLHVAYEYYVAQQREGTSERNDVPKTNLRSSLLCPMADQRRESKDMVLV